MASVQYINIADSEIEVGAPLLSSLAARFRDNPIGIFQRESTSPRLNAVGRIQKLSGSGTYVVPADVYHLKVTYSGGGGGGGVTDGSGGSNGGTTSFEGLPNAAGGLGANDFFDEPSQSPSNALGAAGGIGARSSNGLHGQLRVEYLSVTPAQELTYSVGSGGNGETVVDEESADGADGFIYIEY